MMKRIMVLINAFVLNVLELCNRDCDVWYQPLDVEIRHICFIHFMLYIYIFDSLSLKGLLQLLHLSLP